MSKKKFLPPLKEGSQDDIASYKVLAESLRSHPDTSKFSKSIDAKNIVKLVTGIRKFQDKHLGKDASAWPMVRLPDTFFRDRSSKGPLYTILVSIYRQLGANASIDESEDATTTDSYDKNCEVLKQVETDLVQAGLLRRPIIYFDETVRAHHDLSELETLVTKFGGQVVTDPRQASHVVAHDEEVDSVQAMTKQKRKLWEKQFLRTVAVVRKDAKSHSALVHWWFWPTSSDEWMPAEDVAGIVEDPPVGPDGGPLVVACKFVRDVAKFNEWGVETDYAIEDYQEKVALYKGSTMKTGKKGGKRGRKGGKRGSKSKSPDPSAMQAGGDASKASADAERKSIAGAEDLRTSLKRERNSTMEPRFLNTGYYGIRGEKIRHLVHVGALLMPKESLDILDHLMSSTEGWVKHEEKDPSQIELPGLDAVLRPSEDKANKTITVTELSLATKPAAMSDDQTTALKTVERTRRIDLRRLIDEPERIRGGGGGDGNDGAGDLNSPQPMEIDKPSITNPAPAASVPESAKPTLEAAAQHPQVVPTTGATQVPTPAPGLVSAPTPAPTVPVATTPAPTPPPTVQVATAPVTTPAPSVAATAPTPKPTPSVAVATVPVPKPTPTVAVATVPAPKPTPTVAVSTAQPPKPVSAVSLASTPAPQVTPNPAAVTAQVPKATPAAAVATAQVPKPIPAAADAGATAQVLKPIITEMATVPAPKPVPAAGMTTPPLPKPSPSIPAAAPAPTANKNPAKQPVVAPKAKPASISLGSVSQTSAPKSTTAASKPVPIGKPTPTKNPVPSSAVSSSKVTSTSTPANAATNQKQVVPLPKRPGSHWEQHIPGAQDDTAQEPQMKAPKPSWYDAKKISDFEQQMLPEWFDESARHRTPASYLDVRERTIEMSEKIGNRYLTATMMRRSIPGDAGSLLRMHHFLVAWGFINEESVNDSAPTAPGIREISGSAWRSIEVNSEELSTDSWNEQKRGELLAAVMEQSNKRQKIDHEPLVAESTAGTSPGFPPINWDAVAEKVGNGASSVECEREFLSLPLDDSSSNTAQVERSITPDHMNSAKAPDNTIISSDRVDGKVSQRAIKEQVIRELVDGANPEVVKAATDAAIQAAESLPEAQKSSVLGIMASEAAAVAKKEEESVSRILAEIMEQRMSKLENRLALLDDVEGMLEAERVALELERRDLYTARCRFWFQGN